MLCSHTVYTLQSCPVLRALIQPSHVHTFEMRLPAVQPRTGRCGVSCLTCARERAWTWSAARAASALRSQLSQDGLATQVRCRAVADGNVVVSVETAQNLQLEDGKVLSTSIFFLAVLSCKGVRCPETSIRTILHFVYSMTFPAYVVALFPCAGSWTPERRCFGRRPERLRTSWRSRRVL